MNHKKRRILAIVLAGVLGIMPCTGAGAAESSTGTVQDDTMQNALTGETVEAENGNTYESDSNAEETDVDLNASDAADTSDNAEAETVSEENTADDSSESEAEENSADAVNTDETDAGTSLGSEVVSAVTLSANNDGYTVANSAENGVWYLYQNGVKSTDTVVAANKYGWWYCKDGVVDFTYNGLGDNAYGTWFCTKGRVDFTATGLAHVGKEWYHIVKGKLTEGPELCKNAYGWWYVNDEGKVDFDYTGFATNEKGTWYVKEGRITFEDTGVLKDVSGISGMWGYFSNSLLQTGSVLLKKNDYGWWYIGTDGYVDFTQNALVRNDYGWWVVRKGKINFNFTGFAANEYGTWYAQSGKVNFKANGVLKDYMTGKWGYVKGGKLQTGTITVQKNSYGSWYIGGDGYVDFTFTGTVTVNGVSYSITKGKAANDSLYKYLISLGCSQTRALKIANNTTYIYNYLIAHGFTKAAACAALGNMMQESGMDPTAIEKKYGYGHGLIQWSFDRWDALKAAADKKGVEWTDMDFQLDYLMSEMPGWFKAQSKYQLGYVYTFDQYKKMTDVEDAVVMWEKIVEQAGTVGWTTRYKFANTCYSSF